jgi:hypothetical protein
MLATIALAAPAVSGAWKLDALIWEIIVTVTGLWLPDVVLPFVAAEFPPEELHPATDRMLTAVAAITTCIG